MTINPTDTLGSGELHIPPGVKATTPEQKEMYRAAVEFERFFVSHLMKQMDSATKALAGSSSGNDGGGASSETSGYSDMARDQMTQAVLDGGGLGLAAVLYEQISGGGAR